MSGETPIPRTASASSVALGAAVLFGLSTPLAKTLLAELPPTLLAGLLYLGAGIGLALLRRLRPSRREAPLTRAALPGLASAIGFGGVLGPLLLMWGLSRTPASSASLLLSLEGVFTALLAWCVWHEATDRRLVLGMLLIVAGSLCLGWTGVFEAGALWPALAIVGACLCWGLDNNLTRSIAQYDAAQIASLKGLCAGALNVALAAAGGATLPPAMTLLAALLVGFLGYGLSLVLFVRALARLGSARTGAYFSLAPFVGALGGLLLGEPGGPLFWLAFALMAGGLWLHLSERHAHEHRHEALQHAHRHVHDAHHQHAHDFPWDGCEPHAHPHQHGPLVHTHAHHPDLHHRHGH
ncbi:DMT family transporter [Plasticicumulans acidivorans]|uniref:Drug/metabolite transporter (DMT)-like permease n=1 Tax=Plasticicumulans acidivorans TaxID=886464 RepID=A0A317MTR0_9GAMM|nr:DMT family transporter [Plasticicumulans acidivorans]PWV61098.1 drug/metabolite transporter (DMT)-like permease [Plasticicumulans acidivorans]